MTDREYEAKVDRVGLLVSKDGKEVFILENLADVAPLMAALLAGYFESRSCSLSAYIDHRSGLELAIWEVDDYGLKRCIQKLSEW